MKRSRFWRWRHARPFWGGLFVVLSGLEIFATVRAPLPVIVHVGMQGFIGYLVPIVIALCGVLLLANPAQRLFYSLVAAVLALASWLTSNLGGFVLGLLLGLVGSALAFAWSPDKLRPPDPEPATEDDAEPAADEGGEERATVPATDGQTNSFTPPGVQPETSHKRPRHRRPSPGSGSGE